MRLLYRVLLLAYPRSFRRRFGEAMLGAFEEELREARLRPGVLARLTPLWRAICDTMGTVLEMRWARWRGLPGAPLSRRETQFGWLPSRMRGSASGGAPDPDDKLDSDGPFMRVRHSDVLDALLTDVKFAFRGLRRNPGFGAVIIMTLALGIGASAAVFSVLEAVLLRPLPFVESDRIVQIYDDAPFDDIDWYVSSANLMDWRERNRVFTDIAAIDHLVESEVNLTGVDEPLRISVARVSSNFFDILGVPASLGRTLLPADDAPGAPPVVVMSHGLWAQAFGGDSGELGRTVRLDGEQHTVVGVMPAGFAFFSRDVGRSARLWRPGALHPNRGNRQMRVLEAVARLRPGVTLGQANAEMGAVALDLAEEYPETNQYQGDPWGVKVYTAQQRLVGQVRESLLLLSGAVGIVLLIGWVNATNLLVARTTARRREFELRAAIGAGRGRVVRQLLTETLLLSTLGGAVGLGLARWLIAVFIWAAPLPAGGVSQGLGAIPRLSGAEISEWVIVMTLLTCLATATACGLIPAFRVVRSYPRDGLRAGGVHGRRRGAGGQLLVAVEVALALVLLIGVGLMASTMSRISEIPLGFEPGAVQVLGVQLNQRTYSDPAEGTRRSLRPERNSLVTRVLEQLTAVPTVEVAAAINSLPMRWYRPVARVHFEGLDLPPYPQGQRSDEVPVHGWPDLVTVTPDYFGAMGIRQIQGRTFSSADDRSSPLVAIINQHLADKFRLENPIGQRIKIRDGVTWRSAEIVGVVGAAYKAFPDRHMADQYTGTGSTVYLPFAQPADVYTSRGTGSQMSVLLIARHVGDGEVVRSAMREIFQRADSESPITFLASMEDVVTENLVDRRFHQLIISILAAISLLLALVGIYSVMAFQVGQRVHEIGVRVALGARAPRVVRMIVAEGTRIALLGVLMGVAGAMAATRLLSNWLYGVSPTDPVVFVGLAGAMVMVAASASLLPARRAAAVDPIDSLRAE